MSVRHKAAKRVWGRLSLAILILALYSAQGNTAEQSAMSIGPSKIQVSLLRGGEYQETLRVANESDYALMVNVKPWDFAYDESGQIHPIPEKMSEQFRGCAKWLMPVKSSVAPANTEVKIPITIHVPAQTPVGTHCTYISVSGTPLRKNQKKPSSKTRIRYTLNALLLVIVQSASGTPRLKAGAKLTSFRPDKYINLADQVSLTTRIRNIGNAHLGLNGRIEIRDWDGRIQAAIPIKEHTLLPESRSLIKHKWDEAPFIGKFKAQLIGNCGISDIKQDFKSEPVEFWVISKYLVAIFLSLIIILSASILFLLRNTRFAVQTKQISAQFRKRTKEWWSKHRSRR